MRAIVVEALSDDPGAVRLATVPLPEPGPGAVRVRIAAAAVNFPDLLMVQGRYQFKPPLPFTPGMEAAGTIDALGDGVRGWAAGDAVVAGARFGCWAEAISVPAASLRAVPAGLSLHHAASYGAAYLTAWVALVRRAQLAAGETLLVHGAAGGVGLAAVDLGRHLGARVIATASTEEKRAFLDAYGAALVLPPAGFREAVKAATGGRGADVVFDPVGGDVFDESTRCIAFGGRLLVIGFTSGRIPAIDANIPLIKGFAVMGVRAGEYGRQYPEKGAENIAAIDALMAKAALRPQVHRAFALGEAAAAMRELSERRVIGKVVLTP